MPAKFNPNIHHRKSIRLQGYHYSQAGAYFVTIETFGRACLLGEIVSGEMVLNEWGKIIQKWWDDIPIHFPNVETGAFVIMPNHVHGITIIHARRGAVPAPFVSGDETQGGVSPPLPKRPTLGQIVAYFKCKSTKEINALAGTGVVTQLWQRNYYERIIRNDCQMDATWRCIEATPPIGRRTKTTPSTRRGAGTAPCPAPCNWNEIKFEGGEVQLLTPGTRYKHFCLEVTGLEAYRQTLLEKGVAVTEISLGMDNSRQAWITDPDGNAIELMEYGPQSLQLTGNQR